MSDFLEAVRRDLGSRDEEHRRRAVAALAERIEPEALDLARTALGDDSWRVRKEAVEVLVAWPEPEEVIPSLVRALSQGGNAGLRNAAAEALCRFGERTIEHLMAAASRSDRDTRKFVVDVLGRIGSPRAVSALMAALGDDDPNVRGAAAEALGTIGGAEAAAGLLAALERPDFFTRACALSALGQIGVRIPLERLRELYRERLLRREVLPALGRSGSLEAMPLLAADLREGAAGIRETAMTSLVALVRATGAPGLARVRAELGAAGGEPAVQDAIARTLRSAHAEARRAAALCLGWTGVADHVERLVELADSDEETQEAVAAAVAELGARAVPGLRVAAAAADSSTAARVFAFRSLADAGDRAAAALLVAALGDADPAPAAAAAAALGRLGDADAVEPLLAALARPDAADPDAIVDALVLIAERHPDAVRAPLVGAGAESHGALRVLAEIGREEDVALAGRALHAGDAAVRRAAVAAIARIAARTGAVVVEPLRLALADEDAGVRAAAATALGAAAGGHEAAEALRHALTDEIADVRAAAAGALGRLGDGAAVPALRALTADPAGALAIAAIEALARLAPSDPGPFEVALRHPDPEVLKAALGAVAEGAGGAGGAAAGGRVRREVLAALGYPRWDVRRAAAEAAATFGISSESALRERRQVEADGLVRAALDAALARVRR